MKTALLILGFLCLCGCQSSPKFEAMTDDQIKNAKSASESLTSKGTAETAQVPADGNLPEKFPEAKKVTNVAAASPYDAYVGNYFGSYVPKQGAPESITAVGLEEEYGPTQLSLNTDHTFQLKFLFETSGLWSIKGTNIFLQAKVVNGKKVASVGTMKFRGQEIPLKVFIEPKKVTIADSGKALLDQPTGQPFIVLYQRK